jgi:hypothetical protein
VNGTYSPIRDITFRGSYSKAVREPNNTEQFAPTQGTFQFLTDPCSPANINNGTDFREANCRELIIDFEEFDFTPVPRRVPRLKAYPPATGSLRKKRRTPGRLE